MILFNSACLLTEEGLAARELSGLSARLAMVCSLTLIWTSRCHRSATWMIMRREPVLTNPGIIRHEQSPLNGLKPVLTRAVYCTRVALVVALIWTIFRKRWGCTPR